MSEALAVLVRLDSVKRAVQDIRKGAEKIDNDGGDAEVGVDSSAYRGPVGFVGRQP